MRHYANLTRTWLLLVCLSVATVHADPRSHYMIHCMGCHLSDGSGNPPDVPVFDANILSLLTSESGRAYLVQVPGAAQAPLSDEALSAVINWTLTEFSGLKQNGELKPITPAEVTRFRKDILLDPVKTRAQMGTP